MDRRHLLGALAATCVAAPALAQTMQTQSSSGATSTAAQPHQMGEAEMRHLQQTMMLGSTTLEASRIAKQKAQDDDVKEFAEFEIAEQETIAEILRGMPVQGTDMGGQAGGQAGTSAAAPPASQMDARSREMIQKLQSTSAGRSFDREYVQGQIDGHRQLLAVQEDYLKNGRNREHVTIAKLARGQIKEHLAHLEDIQKDLGRG